MQQIQGPLEKQFPSAGLTLLIPCPAEPTHHDAPANGMFFRHVFFDVVVGIGAGSVLDGEAAVGVLSYP